MAVDIFIKLDGIDGESADKKYAKHIDVLAFSWGVSQSGSMHIGGGGGSGKANVQDLSFTKWIDRSSPTLMLNCCVGKHIKTAKLIVRKAGEKPVDYLVFDLEDVFISSVSLGGSGGEDRLTENVTLNFGKIKEIYTPQKKDGSADAAVEAGFDVAGNVKL